MSFGGGGSQGTIRYALVVDDAQATTKLNTFKTNLTGLATPTATLNKNLAQMGTQLKSTSTSVTQMGTSLKSTGAGISQTTTLVNQQAAAQQKLNTVTATTGKNVATMGNQFKASVTQIKSAGPPLAQLEKSSVSLGTKVKDAGTKFGGLAVGLSATTTSALQLAAGFRDYGDAQIAVDRVTRRLSLGQEALGKAQAKLNELQKSGTASSAELAQARLDVTQAEKQVEIQTQLVGEAQERLFDSQTQFVASVVPTVLGAFGTMSMAIKDFGLKGDSIRKIIPGLSAGFASLAGSIKGINFSALAGGLVTVGAPALAAVAAIWLLIGAIQSFNNINTLFAKAMGKTTEEGIPLYKAAWLDLKQTMPKIFGELTEAEKKFMTDYKKTPEELAITNEAIQKEVTKGFTELNIPPEFQEKFNKIITDIMDKVPGIGEASAKSAKGVDTLGESIEGLTTVTEPLNKAIAYQLGTFDDTADSVSSYADEMVMGEVEVKKFNETTGIVNKAIAYQNGTFDDTAASVSSYADEVAAGEVEVAKIKETFDQWNERISKNVDTQLNAARAADTHKKSLVSLTQEGLAKMDDVFNVLEESERKANEALNQYTDDWRAFAVEFNKRDLDLAKILGLDKKINPDEMFEDLVEDLPKSLEKRLKGALKLDLEMEATNTTVQNYITSLIDGITDAKGETFVWDSNLEVDDKAATEYAENLVDFINKKTSEEDLLADPNLKDLRDDLAEAIDNGADKSEIEAILAEHVEDAPPIKVVVVEDETSKEDVHTHFQKYMDDHPIDVPSMTTPEIEEPIFPGGGFDMGEGLEIPSTAKVDDVVIGNGVDPGQAAFDANPYTATVNKVVFQDTSKIPRIERPEELIRREEERERGEDKSTFETSVSAQLDISAATKNITRLMGNYNGYLRLVETVPVARLNIVAATKNITRLMGNFNGYLAQVSTHEPQARIQITTATKKITRLINNFWGYVKTVNIHEPMIRINNSDALKKISAVKTALKNIPDESVTIKVGVAGAGRSFITQHGFHGWVNKATTFVAGEAGEEYVSVTPKNQMGAASSHAGGGSGGSGTGTIVVNLTNVLADKEIVRTYRRELGKEMYRFGPT